MGYFFIALTVLLTVYGQLILKWQVGLAGPVPPGLAGKAGFRRVFYGDPDLGAGARRAGVGAEGDRDAADRRRGDGLRAYAHATRRLTRP